MVRRASVIAAAIFLAVSLAGAISASAAAPRAHRMVRSISAHDQMTRYVRSHGYIPIGGPAAFERYSATAAAKAARLHPGAAPAVSPHDPVPNPSFQGVDENDIAPPDPTGAIGPKAFVQFINDQMAIWSRSGTLISSAGVEALGGGGHTDYSDPQILWDPATKRFYFLIIRTTNDTFLWGFSKSAKPTSVPDSFCSYTADFGYGSNLPDYPKLGQTKDFLLIGANIYLNLVTFLGADIDWLSKPQTKKKITTCPDASTFKQGQQTGILNADGTTMSSTPEPAVQVDPSSTGWVVAVPDSTNSGATGTELELYQVTRNLDGTANIPQVATAVPVAQYAPPAPAPQSGGTHTIDTLDGRLTHAVSAVDPAHGGATAVWTSHTVFGGAGAEVRWYEIDVANSALFQNGAATDANLFAFNGGISPDRVVRGSKAKFGSDMVLGFSTSGTSADPAIQMVSKVGTSAQSAFVLIQQSPGPDEGFDCFQLGKCRWGDYSGAVPDPNAKLGRSTGRVWLTNMWTSGTIDPLNATWRTWIWAATP